MFIFYILWTGLNNILEDYSSLLLYFRSYVTTPPLLSGFQRILTKVDKRIRTLDRDGGTLESLHGVNQHLISKLQGAGIHSVSDLAATTTSELLEDYYTNYDESVNGIDEATISQLIIKAKQKLIEDGILCKDLTTAENMLEIRKRLIKFSTGSKSFDIFLQGGIETQALTEIAGEFGSGKSQLCYTLCVTVNVQNNDNGVIFVDTENTFRAERIHQIAESRGLDTEKILERIHVCKIYYSSHLEAIIRSLAKYIERYSARLVIIDSVISLHRAEFAGRETLAERQQRLNILLHKLKRLAEIYNIAIVYTNQVQAQPDDFFSNGFNSMIAAGGNIMGHASTYRIFLRKAGRNRIATMFDSPYHEYSQVKFSIGEEGIQDLEEKDNNAASNEAGW
jgi:DNA repair protein RadA